MEALTLEGQGKFAGMSGHFWEGWKVRTNLILRAAVLAVAFSGSAFAASRTWTGNSSGLWSDPTNWDGGVSIPASGDDLIFSSATNIGITIDVPTPVVGA